MKRVIVSAKQFIADIRSGKTDHCLMRDYRLSPTSLLDLKNELLCRRLISLNELRNQMGPVRTRKKINSERFLYDFRQHPDDFYLMERYGLKPHQLKKVYLNLIEKRLLTDFEYESRAVRDPAVDEVHMPAPAVGQLSEASTVVSVVEQWEDSEARFIEQHRDSQLPADFFKDYSGIRIGKGDAADLADFGTPPGSDRPHGSGDQAGNRKTRLEIIGDDYCPRCGTLKNPASEDSCLNCGVVYEKVLCGAKIVAGAIWKNDRR
ncbi:MAG: hypothetical protein V1792_20520 [Pseudomonadota bacterium]